MLAVAGDGVSLHLGANGLSDGLSGAAISSVADNLHRGMCLLPLAGTNGLLSRYRHTSQHEADWENTLEPKSTFQTIMCL